MSFRIEEKLFFKPERIEKISQFFDEKLKIKRFSFKFLMICEK